MEDWSNGSQMGIKTRVADDERTRDLNRLTKAGLIKMAKHKYGLRYTMKDKKADIIDTLVKDTVNPIRKG